IKVDIRERLGGIAYDYLTTATGERLVAETRGDDPIQSGSTVMVDFSDSDALFFDAKTEERLR
ncbi:MAG: ABC transporter ATP-binding protein, partial [Paracoccaceae bacterium]